MPKPKVLIAETGMGWLPYLLETDDHQYEAQKLYCDGLTMKPSEYQRRNCHVSFWYERNGVEQRHTIGLNTICWESDMPHRTCSFPDSKRCIAERVDGVPAAERDTMLYKNAAEIFGLDVKMAGKK